MSKVGRNQPCHCGSGLKFKKCCLRPRGAFDNSSLVAAMAAMQRQASQDEARRIAFGAIGPIKTCTFKGLRIVAVGSQVRWGNWRTLTDFLGDYITELLGPTWGTEEIQSKQLEDRHPILQWYDAFCDLQQRSKESQSEAGLRFAAPDGPSQAYLLLSFHLYLLADHATVHARFLARLRNSDQFQGASYELAVASILVRAGFSIELAEDLDRSRPHPEFYATHLSTGVRFAIEAKSRHRPGVLGRAGAPEENPAGDFNRLLNDAIKQAAAFEMPTLLFLDLNLPPTGSASDDIQQVPWFREIQAKVSSLSRREEAPTFNGIVFTNQPFHYGARGEKVPHQSIVTVRAERSRFEISSPAAIRDVFQAAATFASIPEFPDFCPPAN